MKRELSKDTIDKNSINSPLTFIPNEGQVNSKAKYYFRGTNCGFYFTPENVVMTFVKNNSSDINEKNNGVALALQFIDSNPDVRIEGTCKASGKVNYFREKDRSKWITDLPLYEKIIYKDLWSGVDLVFYGINNALKYDFILKPGASVEDIKLAYKGANGISLDDEGNLQVHNDLGVLIDEKPISHQKIEGKRVIVESYFEMKNKTDNEYYFGFKVLDSYNPNYSLVIDPGLIFSTFLGALVIEPDDDEEDKLGIAVDKAGNTYVTGSTISPSFPVTLGAFQERFPSIDNSVKSSYVTKLNSDGSSLIYSTFLGGTNSDEARGIAIDSIGNAYVTGETSSPDFPVTLGAFQENFPSVNGSSAFVTKLSPDGSQLIYSTFLGGSEDDEGTDIAIDKMGNAYVIGETISTDFPVTLGAFQEVFSEDSGDDVFVTKLNPDGSGLVYSTFLGGDDDDEGQSIFVDDMGNAYVTGNTESSNFPVTLGAFQQINISAPGTDSVFVTKLNPDGSKLIYSTFLSGSNNDQGNGIAVDKMGNTYICGETASPDFPITTGAFQEDFRANEDSAFVAKLNSDGSALIYSTFLNGTGGDNEAQEIAIDYIGNAYVAGFSNSPDFPVTLGSFQEEFQGIGTSDSSYGDAFVAKITPDGSSLIYSTFLGGSGDDIVRNIAIDQEGNAYVVGYTTSSNFPVTLGAFEENFNGVDRGDLFDTFVAKINPTPIL